MTAIVSEYGFREETADISGVSVHCVIKDATATIDATDVSAPDVIVFIHGTASSSLIFFDVMKHLPRNQKCVAIDLPNFGISGRIDLDKYPTNQELCQCYSDIIGHTLQTLGIIEHTVLVAHSLGGFLSIYVADRFPLKKLVLLNPAGILPTLGEYGYYWGDVFQSRSAVVIVSSTAGFARVIGVYVAFVRADDDYDDRILDIPFRKPGQ